MEKKSLLFVTPCLSFAGAEKILCWLAREFAKNGHNSYIMDLGLLDNNSEYRIGDLDGVQVIRLSAAKIPKTNNIYRIIKIASYAKSLKVDLIISFTRYPCVLSVIAGKVANIPVMISERADPSQHRSGMRNKIENLLLNSAAGCVFQTEYAMRFYRKTLQKRSVIIPNPVFESKVHCQSPDRKETDIVSVGRIEMAQKRYDLMIKGFAKFVKSYPEYRLVIYGKGPDEEKVKELIDECGIKGNVVLKGLTTDSLKAMSKGEIFIITSDFEGIPNALLEAMSIGMPVISTDCSPGGARFLITNRENGLLIPTGDYHSVAEALTEFATNRQLRKKCSKNASRVRDLFAPNVLFKEWEKYVLMLSK